MGRKSPEGGTALATIGLLVNPVAGLGGRVGLKGSDGPNTLAEARRRGAVAEAPGRAVEALRTLAGQGIGVVTYPWEMGEDEARLAGLSPTVIGRITPGATSRDDTRRAARELRDLGVDLLLFAGGDGTARDVQAAVGLDQLVLGIPAGVKMHSGVFATSPGEAGRLALAVCRGRVRGVRDGEVMDIDEEAFRQGRVDARLYGYLRVPDEPSGLQAVKTGQARQDEILAGIAQDLAERIAADRERLWLIGPGSTTAAIMQRLGLRGTLLGVDAVLDGSMLLADAGERDLLELLAGRPASIVLTVIGGQGYLLGRGNQQLSPAVLRRVGREGLVVVATQGKLATLGGRPLLVDTGDPDLDLSLHGYIRVTTGYRQETVYRIGASDRRVPR